MFGPHSLASSTVSGSVQMNGVGGVGGVRLAAQRRRVRRHSCPVRMQSGPRNSRPSRTFDFCRTSPIIDQSIAHEPASFVLRLRARRRQHEHHVSAADRGGERGVLRQLRQERLEGRLVRAERLLSRHRQTDDRRANLQLAVERLTRFETGGLERRETRIDAAVAETRGQPRRLRPRSHARRHRPVQRDEHLRLRRRGLRRRRTCDGPSARRGRRGRWKRRVRSETGLASGAWCQGS